MKKFLILLLIIFLFPVEAIAVNTDQIENENLYSFETEDHLPQYVKDILRSSGYDFSEAPDPSSIISYITLYLKNAANKHLSTFSAIAVLILIYTVFAKINDNSVIKTIQSFVFTVICAISLLDLMKGVISITEGSVEDLKELLTVLLPCFTSINLLGGASISSVTEATSFSVVIAILEMILSGILTFPVVICTVVGIFEQVNPTLSDMKLSRSLKKFILTLITFTTTMMMTAIAFQSIISARADGLQTRTVKFAASSFIPLVGNAVGEALRTVSSGVQYLKASIGYASAVSVFLTVFPLICEVLAIKMILTVLAFFSNVTGTNEASGYFDICVGLIDIILAIIICVTLLSFLLVFTFAVVVIGG